MITVPYSTVLYGVCDLAGLDRDAIPTDQAQIIQHAINRRLQIIWAQWPWPELLNLEKRLFRDVWATATTYAASTATTAVEVYYYPTGKYYQSLRGSNQGNVPATLTGTTYTENSDYWAECKETYSGNDWRDATAYVATDGAPSIVRNPADGRFYQCHTAHTSSGSLDATKFCVLTEFDRYIAYEQTGKTKIGDVLGVWSERPTKVRNSAQLDYHLSANGIQVLDDEYAEVWVEFKTKIPQLTGATYSATATYTANVDQVYFSNSTSSYPGNFYDCIVNTSAGQSPVTTASSWSIVSIPRIFQRYLEQGAYADYLASDGQNDKRAIESMMADESMSDLIARYGMVQNQVRPAVVLTR
jgi:hypothetical protein